MPAAKLERWFLVVWLLITTWLLFCALIVQGEYGDGYQTIVNARHFFGDSPNFYVQRGPLAAIALWPVEAVVRLFAFDPIDVRPHHVFTALLHSAYLFGCWIVLRRAPGGAAARLVAFGAAILSVMFYAYAPYLSHDVIPGLLFLLLIFLCHRWLEHRQPTDAVYLVLLGAAVTLIKQAYAIFWFAIMLYAALAFLLKWDQRRVTLRKFAELGLLAFASAAISWLGYAWFVGGEIPGEALLARPLRLIAAISSQYGDEMTGVFAADLYFRNLPNYGIAAMLLVIPGLVLALRGTDGRMRQIAVCWLVAVIIMQLVGFREARYLIFLAPLTAMLIVPVVQLLFSRQLAIVSLLLLVLFDQSRGIGVAATELTSTGTIDVARFMNAPDGDPGGNVVASQVLSFVYSAASPLARDRYHGIYHLTPALLTGLHEGLIQPTTINKANESGLSGIEPGDRVYYSNLTMVRRPPWTDDNSPNGLSDFLLVAGDAVTLELVSNPGSYERIDNDGSYVMFLPGPDVGEQMPVISTGTLPVAAASRLYGDVTSRDRLQVLAVQVNALCLADSCQYR